MTRVLPLALIASACVLAGCGGQRRATQTTVAGPVKTPLGLAVRVVGNLAVSVPGAIVTSGPLDSTLGDSLVVVSSDDPAAVRTPQVAAAQPSTHFVVVGASEARWRLSNLAGLLLRDDQAARLGGIVAGLVVADQPAPGARVAWVGPLQPPLAAAFLRGVHEVAPGTVVLRVWSNDTPAACKEAALGAIGRGATVVMAGRGTCASAAISGAHEQNQPGLQLADFELPAIAASQVVREAVDGVYHGREDLVFGLAAGAVGVNTLDRRISAAVAVRARTLAQQLASAPGSSG